MKIYLVGGAIRNKLLNLPITDRDWVVVGSNQKELINLGFQQVGKSFPVFIHPITKEEYALARKEKKNGIGYTGFSCQISSNIKIEEDLFRRDLTINAIAQSIDGKIIDPYNGINDIKKRILRHISSKFIEDPLRLLRVARFAAMLFKKKFTIAHETINLMRKIVLNKELSTIPAERIWKETEKALNSPAPEIFFITLKKCGALKILFPEIHQLFKIPYLKKDHQVMNFGEHSLLTLKITSSLTKKISVRFAALCHDITCYLDFKKKENNYRNKTILIEKMCQRLRIPKKIKKITKLISFFHEKIHVIDQLNVKKLIQLLNHIDCWRKPEHIQYLCIICYADKHNKIINNPYIYKKNKFLLEAYNICKTITSKKVKIKNLNGIEIFNKILKKRTNILSIWKKNKNF
ncbi:MAG: multifunctional CCA addition/repair protein [Arsenophonus sp.]|nr:MAG: multifunctional CCA addition/repair protein [Arsenophonus sp.]